MLLTATALQLPAQDAKPAGIKWWFDPGMGTYTTFSAKNDFRITYTIGTTVQNNQLLYKLRYLYNDEISNITGGLSPSEYYNSYNFLLGKRLSETTYTQINLYAGIGITTGLKRGYFIESKVAPIFSTDKYTDDQFITPSIPIELEFMFKAINYVGIGGGLFFEINFKQPIIGITGRAFVGKLR